MINQNEQERKLQATEEPESSPLALLYYTDLMFGVQLQNMARKTGYRFSVARPGAPLPDADVMVVDMGSRAEWEAAIREVSARGVPVIAFGSHMDAEGRKRAKAAGAMRVLANSNLARDLPGILLNLREQNSIAAEEDQHDS
ncbi:MAG: hypothetical protein M3328_10715 [Chloroflexota bacterium]|nr:hypothetical protein [Chloroflexota bacterium]